MNHKNKKESFSIVGAGRVGTTLGLLLNQAGYRPLEVVDRLPDQAVRAVALMGAGCPAAGLTGRLRTGSFIILSVPDREIAAVAKNLSETDMIWNRRVVFHCSGSETASILSPLSRKGASTGSFHPIQTFSEPALTARRIKNSWFGIEGGDQFKILAKRLIHDLGGRILDVPKNRKVPYHTAAVMASNFLIALIDQAAGLMSLAGLNKEDAVKALLPLIEGTVAEIEQHGTADALTGPIERGDDETVRAHLNFLRKLDPSKTGLYRLLSRAAIQLAREKGFSGLEKVEAVLDNEEKGREE